MKKFVTILLILSATSLLACPFLAGDYACVSEQGESTQTVTQEGNSIVIGEGAIPMTLDGISHNLGQGASYTASCNGEIISASIVAPDYNATTTVIKTSTGYIERSEGSGAGPEEVCTKL